MYHNVCWSFFLCPYPLAEGPEGILKVFCRLNLLVAMESADCDKLMLRFLKNSKPPVELGSYRYAVYNVGRFSQRGNEQKKQVIYLSGGGWGWSLHLPRTNGFKESDHVPAEVPLALFKRRVEKQSGVLSAHCWNLHVLWWEGQKQKKTDCDVMTP